VHNGASQFIERVLIGLQIYHSRLPPHVVVYSQSPSCGVAGSYGDRGSTSSDQSQVGSGAHVLYDRAEIVRLTYDLYGLSPVLQGALEMPQIWAPDLAYRAYRIELQEDKESTTWLFEVFHALSDEGSQIFTSDPLVPDSMVSPIARLADKYNVAGLVKAFFCATTINTWSREPFWQTFILGIATKDIILCRKSITKFRSTTRAVCYWSQVDARLVGLDVYWALVKATQDWMDSTGADESATDWNYITERVDWPKALGV
jgi:hypothetical protein